MLLRGVRAITGLILTPGLVNLDFADVSAVMRDRGLALMGTGEAEGDGRAAAAVESALDNPLLESTDISQAEGVLAGLVAVTAGCAVVEPWAALVIGAGGGLCMFAASRFLRRRMIDDALDASAVHFFAGLWGLVAVGLFATRRDVRDLYGHSASPGLFYGGGVKQLGVQSLGAACLGAWTLLLSAALLVGRVIQRDEQGVDMRSQDLMCMTH